MSRKLIQNILLSAAFLAPVYAAENTAPTLPDEDDFQIFLLAGQSNMAGRGEVTEADQEINPRVLMLAKDGSWQYAVDPVHYDKKQAGAGLARGFALRLLEQDADISIGLVPAACGGSPISTWVPGAYHEQTDSHPYDDAIKRAKRAMQDGKLAGILWHQGESDSRPARASVYKERLIELVQRFRHDLNTPDLPIIIGQLGQFEGKPWTEDRQRINQAQIEVAAEISMTAFVPSDGLTSKADNTHFNTESLNEFGRRYATQYLQLTENLENPGSE